jgi:hypothetical protein
MAVPSRKLNTFHRIASKRHKKSLIDHRCLSLSFLSIQSTLSDASKPRIYFIGRADKTDWFPRGVPVRFVSGCNTVGFSGELDMAFLNAKAEFSDLNDPKFIYTMSSMQIFILKSSWPVVVDWWVDSRKLVVWGMDLFFRLYLSMLRPAGGLFGTVGRLYKTTIM